MATVLRSNYHFPVSGVDSALFQLKKNRRDFLPSWISHQCSPKVTFDDGGFTGTRMKRKRTYFHSSSHRLLPCVVKSNGASRS